jgi:hypothetical protein
MKKEEKKKDEGNEGGRKGRKSYNLELHGSLLLNQIAPLQKP